MLSDIPPTTSPQYAMFLRCGTQYSLVRRCLGARVRSTESFAAVTTGHAQGPDSSKRVDGRARAVDARGKQSLQGFQHGNSSVETEWIRKVSSTPKPAFAWSQPLANLPDFPDVEAFLRAPDHTCYGCGIHSLPEARKFAKKYFDGSYNLKDGFSAQGTPGGRGPDAYCKIEKADAVYLAVVKAWEDEQKEAAELRSKIACIDESPVAKRLKTLI